MKVHLIQRKSIIAIVVIATVLILGTGIGFYLMAPSNVLAIDVNPSIELHTNRLNHVVSINPVNEDAIQLLSGYTPEDRDLESVIEDIVDRMIFFGYLTSDQTNQILITADTSGVSTELLNKTNTTIADYLAERKLQVEVLEQQIDISKAEEDAAHEYNVSFGKMAIIDELIANGSNMTTEELASSSISQLVDYATKEDISVEDLIDNYNETAQEQTSEEADLDIEDADLDIEDADEAAEDAVSGATVKATDENGISISESTTGANQASDEAAVDTVSGATRKTSDKNGTAVSKDVSATSEDTDKAAVDAVSGATKKATDEDGDDDSEDAFEDGEDEEDDAEDDADDEVEDDADEAANKNEIEDDQDSDEASEHEDVYYEDSNYEEIEDEDSNENNSSEDNYYSDEEDEEDDDSENDNHQGEDDED